MHLTQLEAFALTLAVESVTAAVLAPAFQLSRGRAALSAVAASAMTHPVLWLTFYEVYAVLGVMTTPVLEAIVILAEAPFYRFIARVGWLDALLLSLLINAASWAVGELIYALL
jgi:hypothetical protein